MPVSEHFVPIQWDRNNNRVIVLVDNAACVPLKQAIFVEGVQNVGVSLEMYIDSFTPVCVWNGWYHRVYSKFDPNLRSFRIDGENIEGDIALVLNRMMYPKGLEAHFVWRWEEADVSTAL